MSGTSTERVLAPELTAIDVYRHVGCPFYCRPNGNGAATQHARRPPNETFQYLADLEHEGRWNPWAMEVAKVTSGPIGPGSRFRGRYKLFGVVEQELADYQPPHRITYRSNTMGAASMSFALEPHASGTLITLI